MTLDVSDAEYVELIGSLVSNRTANISIHYSLHCFIDSLRIVSLDRGSVRASE